MPKSLPEEDSKSSKTPLIAVYKEKPDLRKKEPPLINLQVTNPLTYLKSWWKRVIGGEGIDVRLRIHPLTAVALTVIVASLGFGIGRFALSSEKPYVTFVPISPSPSPILWRETAFIGTLRFSEPNNRYYLVTSSSEAIALEIPENVELSSLVGRRIFAAGNYNETKRTLLVTDASDMEVLPKAIVPVPVVSPLPTLTPSPEAQDVDFPPEAIPSDSTPSASN